MVSPSDKEYASTKLIMKGEAKMEIDFMPLADYINKKYIVNTLNIIYDAIDNDTRPRLNIIFEKFEEAEKFKKSLALMMLSNERLQRNLK